MAFAPSRRRAGCAVTVTEVTLPINARVILQYRSRDSQATYEEARDYFVRAEALDPGFWKANQLYLGISESRLGHT